MTRILLAGVDGSNPLGFLAALGILRIVTCGRLGFLDDGSFRAFVESPYVDRPKLVELIAADAETSRGENASWRFTYTKAATKKRGALEVADLKAPPDDFKRYLEASVEAWISGDGEPAAYSAAYGTDVAADNNGNTKPTAFHFTAANQTFLGAVEGIRASVTRARIDRSLFEGHGGMPGSNLRWDPSAERNWALMANDPNAEGTSVDAPLEWLAFRGLPLLPTFPRGSRIVTTGVDGSRDDMTFMWPLWSIPATFQTTRSALQVDWSGGTKARAARGVFAICRSAIRRTKQGGFGNFGPSSVTC